MSIMTFILVFDYIKVAIKKFNLILIISSLHSWTTHSTFFFIFFIFLFTLNSNFLKKNYVKSYKELTISCLGSGSLTSILLITSKNISLTFSPVFAEHS